MKFYIKLIPHDNSWEVNLTSEMQNITATEYFKDYNLARNRIEDIQAQLEERKHKAFVFLGQQNFVDMDDYVMGVSP